MDQDKIGILKLEKVVWWKFCERHIMLCYNIQIIYKYMEHIIF